MSLKLAFMKPLILNAANSLSQFKFGAWNLKWSFNYGSPEIPGKRTGIEKSGTYLKMGKTSGLTYSKFKAGAHGSD